MNHSPRSPLITVEALAARLRDPSPPVVLDVRWTLTGGSDPAGFEAGHIPGARFVDLDRDLAAEAGSGGRHPLPDPADLEVALRSVGLDDGDAVVVYDGGPGLGAARAWWLLRWAGLDTVQVLDGGYPAWAEQPAAAPGGPSGPAAARPARPTESGPPDLVAPGTITVRPGGLPTVDADGAAAAANAPGEVLLDLRAAARYRGEVEPLDPVAGHIPGAVNLPIAELMRADGTYRSAAEVAERLGAAGVGAGVQVVASCGSGITACQLVLVAERAGIRATLYPGSYSQWCALGRPVDTGR